MDLTFNEPVRPLTMSSLKVTGATLKSVVRLSATSSRATLEGDGGSAVATLVMLSFSDLAGNAGLVGACVRGGGCVTSTARPCRTPAVHAGAAGKVRS